MNTYKIDNCELAVINGELYQKVEPENAPQREVKADGVVKKRGRPRKQLITPPVKTGKVSGYECLDCGKPFQSNLSLLDARCPSCNSIEVRKSVESKIKVSDYK